MCHARDAILVCLDHRIPVLWKRDVSTLGLYFYPCFVSLLFWIAVTIMINPSV